jgi:hypothetical protein
LSDEFFIPIPFEACLTIGYSLYFTGVSMFLWMALLCFDLFWTFAHLRTPQEQKGCSKKLVFLKNIIIYSYLHFFNKTTSLKIKVDVHKHSSKSLFK